MERAGLYLTAMVCMCRRGGGPGGGAGGGSLEVQSQAVGVHAGAAVAAGHLARQAVATVLGLYDGVRGQHHIGGPQLLQVARPLLPMVDDHLRCLPSVTAGIRLSAVYLPTPPTGLPGQATNVAGAGSTAAIGNGKCNARVCTQIQT